jgi:hypothetical protein
MRKAYDTFLLSEVSAGLAAKAGSFEPYRYECAELNSISTIIQRCFILA